MKESEATIRRTRELTEDALRRAHLDVRRLVGELEVARTNLTAAELNVTRAQDALRITTLTYDNGKADYLSVLNAQADRSEARKNLIDARHDVLARTASLKRAMGVSPTEPLAAVFQRSR